MERNKPVRTLAEVRADIASYTRPQLIAASRKIDAPTPQAQMAALRELMDLDIKAGILKPATNGRNAGYVEMQPGILYLLQP